MGVCEFWEQANQTCAAGYLVPGSRRERHAKHHKIFVKHFGTHFQAASSNGGCPRLHPMSMLVCLIIVLLGTWFVDRDESDMQNSRKHLSNILESTSKQPPPTEAAQDYT